MRHGFLGLACVGLMACSSGGGAGTGGSTAATTTTATSSGGGGTGGASTTSTTSSGGAGGDAGVPDASPPPESVCGAADEPITSVSTTWGPAWAPPDPSMILNGWPLDIRYELWWVPMPAAPEGVLAYRIEVPADFDSSVDATPTAQQAYVHTAESPSTPVAAYDYALSETACDFDHPVPIQSDAPPYGPSGNFASGTQQNAIGQNFQVRPKGMTHCVPLAGGGYYSACLEPGHTYWWNLRLVPGGCNGNTTDTSACQPMIHVERPRKVGEP
jgi:hypothetical protein